MVHARHRLCPLATVGCAAVCLTETQLSLVSGSCNGRGGSLRGRRLFPRRPPPLRGRRVDIAPGQSVVKQSDRCAHHINEYQSRSAIVALRRRPRPRRILRCNGDDGDGNGVGRKPVIIAPKSKTKEDSLGERRSNQCINGCDGKFSARASACGGALSAAVVHLWATPSPPCDGFLVHTA